MNRRAFLKTISAGLYAAAPAILLPTRTVIDLNPQGWRDDTARVRAMFDAVPQIEAMRQRATILKVGQCYRDAQGNWHIENWSMDCRNVATPTPFFGEALFCGYSFSELAAIAAGQGAA